MRRFFWSITNLQYEILDLEGRLYDLQEESYNGYVSRLDAREQSEQLRENISDLQSQIADEERHEEAVEAQIRSMGGQINDPGTASKLTYNLNPYCLGVCIY